MLMDLSGVENSKLPAAEPLPSSGRIWGWQWWFLPPQSWISLRSFLYISSIFLYLALACDSILHPNSLYIVHFMYVRYHFCSFYFLRSDLAYSSMSQVGKLSSAGKKRVKEHFTHFIITFVLKSRSSSEKTAKNDFFLIKNNFSNDI